VRSLKAVLLLLVVVLFAAAAGNAHAVEAPPLVPRDPASLSERPHALVQVESSDRGTSAAGALRRAGGSLVSEELGIWRVPGTAAARLLPALALADAIRDAEPDHPRRALDHLAAGDPLLPQQWWLPHIGADQVEPPGPGVPVTVVDGGLDLTHPEFAGRPHTTALNEQSIRFPNDFHGTAVASVIAAPANGVGLVGVYPQAALYSWDASPFGRELTTADVIRGINAAATLGRGVINLSLGGAARSRLEELAIVNAFERGAITVAASGNERERGNRPSFPAALPHVLTVGAVDGAARLVPFSSSSPGMDLVAPGVSIPVAAPLALVPSGFAAVDGTSFAAPLVSGALAWVWTVRPELDKTQVFELMRRSATDLAPAGRNADTGFGLLNIPRALTMPAPAVDPFEPNDTLDQVIPGRLFRDGKPPVTRPGVGRNIVNARLDVTVDPRDVYRVWAPARSRVVVRLTGPGTVELRYAGATAIRNASRLAPRQFEMVNRQPAGAWVYVTALIRPAALPTHATYRLDVTTGPAPPLRR
jgi:subtilisin family serine protease